MLVVLVRTPFIAVVELRLSLPCLGRCFGPRHRVPRRRLPACPKELPLRTRAFAGVVVLCLFGVSRPWMLCKGVDIPSVLFTREEGG